MADMNDGNDCTASTTWEWRKVRVTPAPNGQESRPSAARSFHGLLPWPKRKPLTLTVRWRGGNECWWEIRTRGRTIRRPGHLALHDVLVEVMGWPR